MPHDSPLIATIVIGLVLAFVLGAVAARLRISPIVGYLLAGVAVGPYTPGFVADQTLARDLAEIGVILLMFGVGLHFSLKDLLSVKAIAIPGAIIQIVIATLLGMGLAWSLGWSPGAGVVFGLALSVASTVVLLRAVQDRRMIESEPGRIAVGWLIVEDLAMILAIVLLPPLAGILAEGESWRTPEPIEILKTVGFTFGMVAVFVALMLIVGRRVIPWLLHQIAHTGSRELFRLAVLATALGVAYGSAELFGVSFALGAFFAGMVMAESQLSSQAAQESLPLRDAFAVLFFVSVGMLVDPAILVRDIWPLVATLFIILVGKSVAALAIMLAFRYPMGTALTISASLAQIGEFSFILAGLGIALNVLPDQARDLILAGAILSILLNPLFFAGIDRLVPWLGRRRGSAAPAPASVAAAAPAEPSTSTLIDHAVLIGYGRVGSVVGEAFKERGLPFLVVEENPEILIAVRAQGIAAVAGPDAPDALLRLANIAAARSLFVAIPNSFEAGQFVEQGRAMNPALRIVARAHGDAEVDYLVKLGADFAVMGEREIGKAMAAQGLDAQPT